MVFPIGDTNVKGGAYPIFTYLFIAANILIFIFQFLGNDMICSYATIPNDIANGRNYFTLFSSMFLHGGWMHLIGNMMFLWVFADNIEAVVGNAFFVVFYIAGGIIGSLVHTYLSVGDLAVDCCTVCDNLIGLTQKCDMTMSGVAANVCKGSVPSVGASGAISAVLGAYFIMFPGSKIKVLFFIRTFTISALLFLGFWIVQQLISGFTSLGMGGTSAGVAWWAHIGGFMFGVLMGFLFRKWFPKIDLIQKAPELRPEYRSRRRGF